MPSSEYSFMNDRAYYYDSYTVQFEAAIVEHVLVDNRPAIVLDKTFFYPTSGGQPNDKGRIDGIAVVDVLIRQEDGAVLHFLKQETELDEVSAEIDWPRRFDHMQHHTGQHILSQAFIQIANAQTIGFHLSDASITIDLDKQNLSNVQVAQAEQLANEIVWQNRPVLVREVSMDEAAGLPLRKIPPTQNGKLRLVDIEAFDLTACGGTHVIRTGEVGIIKVIKQEKRGDKLRIEFRCGKRALHDYQDKHEVIVELTSRLTTGSSKLDAAVVKLQDENKQARRQLKKQQAALSQLEAANIINQAKKVEDTTFITKVFSDRDQGQIRALSSQLIRHGNVIALLGLSGDKSQLIFSRSADAPGHMGIILKEALKELGSKSGGGSEVFAQGVGPPANTAVVENAIQTAEKKLLEELGSLG